MGHTHGVDSEVGRLRTVLAHRPGAELLRITPRTNDRLQFPGVPWVARAQQEHDIAAQCLRDQGVEVLYVMELLQDVMEYPTARAEAIIAVLGAQHLGERLRGDVGSHLAGLDPEDLAHVLVAGLSPEEFRPGHGVVFGLMDRHDFVIPPMPNLMFLRDSHLWIGPAVALASLELLETDDWRGRVGRIERGLVDGLAPARELAGVRDVRVLGAIGVIELEEPVDVAAATAAAVDLGVWLRPFGNLVYTMPPYVSGDEDVARIAAAVVAAAGAGAQA